MSGHNGLQQVVNEAHGPCGLTRELELARL